MKKKFIILLISLSFVLCACGSSLANESLGITANYTYADQQRFLSDMAKGINNRLAKVDDEKHANDTDEQKAKYFMELVKCELDQIEKYEIQSFSDETFDRLSHHYISACKMQQTAVMLYKNRDLYTELWNSGRSVRAAIITEFYYWYDLPLSSEAIASYVPNANSYALSTTQSASSFNPDKIIDEIEITEIGKRNEKSGEEHYYFKVFNSSNKDLIFSIDVRYYDSTKTLIDTHTIPVIAPSKQCDIVYSSTSIIYSFFTYNISDIKEYWQTAYNDISFTASETIKGRIVGEVNNTGNCKAYMTAYVLFYDNKGFVDSQCDIIGNILPGESRVFEVNTKKDYSKYEIYYNCVTSD